MEKNKARGTGNFPAAIGLNFLNGCSWSFLRSTISLKKYTDEVRIEKMTIAEMVIIKLWGWKSCPEKTKAAARLKFFSHCLGLAVLRR